MSRILILGSLNIDLVQRVPRLPVCGETIRGQDFAIHVGGKGANQACAAARMGGRAIFAGMLGSDVFAERVRFELIATGVLMDFVRSSPAASGTATILVLPSGDNVIVIAPGANADVTPQLAREAVATLGPADYLLCQLEIPLETVSAGLTAARSRGATTILDPAPASDLPDELLRDVSILTPNQTEASVLCRMSEPVTDTHQAARAAAVLRQRGPQIVIIKMGEAGCFISSPDLESEVRGFTVRAVDTTAAGDAFNGALAVALSEGRPLAEAVRFANAAGALSVTMPGAIPSIPARADVDALFEGAANVRRA